MKKTLKILMAIILFAVVLTIATSVNAATEPAKGGVTVLDKIIQDNYDATPRDESTIKYEDGFYKITAALEVADKVVIPAGKTVYIDLAKAATTYEFEANMEVNGTLVVSVSGTAVAVPTMAGTIDVNGTLKTPMLSTKINNKGTVISTASTAITLSADNFSNEGTIYGKVTPVADTDVVLNLKDDLTVEGTKYKAIVLPKKDLDNKIEFVVENITKSTEVTPVTKLEEGEAYKINVKAYYLKSSTEKLELTDNVTIATPKTAGATANCTVDANGVVTVGKKLGNDSNVRVSATVAGITKDLAAIPVGTEIKNEEPNQPENPDQPNKPEEPNKPSDENKGDLDDAAAVATGDHIIPATALLAVVVVANVVYFAKSKRS